MEEQFSFPNGLSYDPDDDPLRDAIENYDPAAEKEGEVKRPYGLHTASDAVFATFDTIEDRRQQVASGTALAGIFGIPLIDTYIRPLWQGQTIYLVAMMSNGKSLTARMAAVNVLKSLMENENDDRVVVWITVEEPVETVTASWLSAMGRISSSDVMSGGISDVQMHHLRGQIAEISTWPLLIVGKTLSQRGADGIKRQGSLMTRGQIEKCLDYIMNVMKKDIAFIVLDYMQRVDFDDGDYQGMEPHMRKTVDWNRSISLWAACPFMICAQAAKASTEKKFAIPGMTNVGWTNKAGQDADMMISTAMPKTIYGVGSELDDIFLGYGFDEHGALLSRKLTVPLTVESGHMFVKITKNRGNEAGGLFLLDTQPGLMQWDLMLPTSVEEELWGAPNDLQEQQGPSMGHRRPEQKRIPY